MKYGSQVRASSLGEINLQGTQRVIFEFEAKYSGRITSVRWISKQTGGYAAGTGGIIEVLMMKDNVPLGRGVLANPLQANPGVVMLFPEVQFSPWPYVIEGETYCLLFSNIHGNPYENWGSLDGAHVVPDALDLNDYRAYILNNIGKPVRNLNNNPLIELNYDHGRSQGHGYIDVLNSRSKPLNGVAERFIPSVPLLIHGGAICLNNLKASGTIQLAMGSWPPQGQQIVDSVLLPAPMTQGCWSRFYFSKSWPVDNQRLWWLIPKGDSTISPIQKGTNPGGFGPDTYFADGYAAIDGAAWPSISGPDIRLDLQFYLDVEAR